MRLTGENVLRLILALTILVSVFIRPPGTMLSLDGEKISYVICTGGAPETIEVLLDGEIGHEIDISCDFFAAQIAALTIGAPENPPVAADISHVYATPFLAPSETRRLWSPHTARVPPIVS